MNINKKIELLRNNGYSWKEVGLELGMSGDVARGRYYRYRKKKKKGNNEPAPQKDVFANIDTKIIFEGKNKKEYVNWREIAKAADKIQDISSKLNDKQEYAKIIIKTNTPYIVCYTADWHLGSMGTSHIKWVNEMEALLNTENLGIMVLGDTIQNMRSFKVLSAVLAQAIPPPIQANMFKSIVDEMVEKNKLIALIDGNHDAEFDSRIFGEELQGYLLENCPAPRFRNRGLIDLVIKNNKHEETYTQLLFHKSRFRSILNPTHGALREYQFDFPAEIVCGAHDHSPAFQAIWQNLRAYKTDKGFGGETFLMKVGTYQEKSDFGYAYFHNGGIPLNHFVVYFPDKHKKIWAPSLEDALRIRKGFE